MILLVIVNLADDKKEHLDEVALSNMSSMYNNNNLTATDITITGKINFKGGDGTVTTLANPGGKLLTSDSNINANGLVVGQTVDPDWHYGIAIGAAANIEAVTGKIKHNTGWQMYGNGAAWFPVDLEVVGPIIARDSIVTTKITADIDKSSKTELNFWASKINTPPLSATHIHTGWLDVDGPGSFGSWVKGGVGKSCVAYIGC
jgi:hypothetical protein